MPTALELRTERGRTWERMKEIVDRAEAENRDLTGEESSNWDRANADITSLDARIERQLLLERTPATEAEQRRFAPGREAPAPGGNGGTTPAASPEEYREVFNRYVVYGRGELNADDQRLLRSGLTPLSDAERRALGVGNTVSAGYLVPNEYERNILQNMLAFGGMREAATIMPTDTGADLIMPTSDDTGNTGELLAEHASVTAQDVTVGRKILKAHMYSSKRVNVSFQLLQDSAFGIDTWLSELLAERIARITNTHFTTGSGSNQPTGVATEATSGAAGATGQTTTVTWDDLITLEHSIDPAYRRNARFMMADATLQYLRKVKDGEGRYLWQPGVTAGAPSLINGWPYAINQDVAAQAASAKSILFGDFKKYVIRDVRGFFLLRLDELYAESGQVAFIGFSRHDGMLLHAGTVPIKAYVNSAS